MVASALRANFLPLWTTLKESTSKNVAPSIWALSGWGRGKLCQSFFQGGGGSIFAVAFF